ncbi:MAG: FG-GAP repeat domain-containing protein [Pyrinomonadaceae bacterium]
MILRVLSSGGKRQKLFRWVAALALVTTVVFGVFARNGWLPSTDPVSGKKTGWFGKQLPKNASSSWNPFAPPLPTPTPQLSKEYIYAGSRLLAVEDASANAAPPADLAVWRPSTGVWWVLNSNNPSTPYTVATWGAASDEPVPGDYDGDGKTDFSIYRRSTGEWWVVYSSSGTSAAITFGGGSADQTAQADFDGDGKTDTAVFRPNDPSSGLATWYIRRSSDASFYAVQFGESSDTPAAADYDGDGRADVGVWRDATTTFYSIDSATGTLRTAVFGSSGSIPVSADYDGDGKANFALKNANNWTILNAAGTATSNTAWQSAGDIPAQNDYDADGKCDIAVWRESTGVWYIRQSSRLGQSNELRQQEWGAPGDIPVPALYRR